ncbi:MAG: ammonium transporter [Leptolyngbyaceae cyanobacterium bins.59]|nr:ammonium transporter [Leptolyngbyaceae cyanobacterium bins.59]
MAPSSKVSRRSVPSRNQWLVMQRAIERLAPSWQACIPLSLILIMVWGYAAIAQETPPSEITTKELKVAVDSVWALFAAFLVFFMNAGFCMLETGFCRQKNAVNLLAKNLIVFALSTIGFWSIGFGLMFGDGTPFIGLNGWFLSGLDNSPMTNEDYQGVFSALKWAGIPLSIKFLFQLVFAGTAATIVSGAVAERIKFVAFLVFSLILTALIYPITGHWIWGGGWLSKVGSGFWDFAGSTVVHSVGGWCALLGAAILGPRLGRYRKGGGAIAMPGHNMSIATLGCLILWLGWFGFNPGSTLAADPAAIGHIAVATNTAAAFGAFAATLTSWLYFKQPDLSMIINGVLAGLVSITASCAYVSFSSAAIIGTIAGIIIVFSVVFFDSLKIDDPVGAISVHLVNGTWGTIAVGLFSVGPDVYTWYKAGGGPAMGLLLGGGFEQLGIQLLGVLSVAAFTVASATIVWLAIKSVLGLRVSAEEEIRGLDDGEHGMEAYAGFVKEAERLP